MSQTQNPQVAEPTTTLAIPEPGIVQDDPGTLLDAVLNDPASVAKLQAALAVQAVPAAPVVAVAPTAVTPAPLAQPPSTLGLSNGINGILLAKDMIKNGYLSPTAKMKELIARAGPGPDPHDLTEEFAKIGKSMVASSFMAYQVKMGKEVDRCQLSWSSNYLIASGGGPIESDLPMSSGVGLVTEDPIQAEVARINNNVRSTQYVAVTAQSQVMNMTPQQQQQQQQQQMMQQPIQGLQQQQMMQQPIQGLQQNQQMLQPIQGLQQNVQLQQQQQNFGRGRGKNNNHNNGRRQNQQRGQGFPQHNQQTYQQF